MSAPKQAMVFPVRFAHARHVEQTTSRELSVEGVFVRCQQPPRAGTLVSMKLYLPDQPKTADLVGVVRGLDEGSTGGGFWADFLKPDHDSQQRLSALLVPAEAEPRAARPPPPLRAPPAPARPIPLDDGNPENRRTSPRYPARFAVHLSRVSDFVREYSANLSAGGAFVVTDNPPDLDSVIAVVLELPGGGEPIGCKGLVVHRVTPEQARARQTDAGAGVQFLEVDDAFRARIAKTIALIKAGHRD